MHSEELRFLNNLSILIGLGRPLGSSLRVLRDGCRDSLAPTFDEMAAEAERLGGDFTTVLAEHPELCSRSSLALLRAARRSGCLAIVLPKLANLVRSRFEGGLGPHSRFFHTWALLTESGFNTDEALSELIEEFKAGPLGEVAVGLRAAAREGKTLAEGAKAFPEVFSAASLDLLTYGESRDLPNALRAITRLV